MDLYYRARHFMPYNAGLGPQTGLDCTHDYRQKWAHTDTPGVVHERYQYIGGWQNE